MGNKVATLGSSDTATKQAKTTVAIKANLNNKENRLKKKTRKVSFQDDLYSDLEESIGRKQSFRDTEIMSPQMAQLKKDKKSKTSDKTYHHIAEPRRKWGVKLDDASNLTHTSAVIESRIYEYYCMDESTFYLDEDHEQFFIKVLKKRETRNVFSANFLLLRNPEITVHMRSSVVNWLINIQTCLDDIFEETLHRAVVMMDKFLSSQPIYGANLQLVAMSCFHIACKLDNPFPPDWDTLLDYESCIYTSDDDVIRIERTLIHIMELDTVIPTPHDFLESYLMTFLHNQQVKNLCLYLLDLILTDIECLVHTASIRAAASLCLARYILFENEEEAWTPGIQYYSTYTENDLEICMQRMAKLLLSVERSRYEGAYEKYRDEMFGGISDHPALTTSTKVQELTHRCLGKYHSGEA